MATIETTKFKHVSYLWDEAKAAELAGDEVGLLVYRSNLSIVNRRLTNWSDIPVILLHHRQVLQALASSHR